MSIRLIAQDLYRLVREVEKLEKQLEQLPHDKAAGVKEKLRKVKAERNLVRKMLDGAKDEPKKRRF